MEKIDRAHITDPVVITDEIYKDWPLAVRILISGFKSYTHEPATPIYLPTVLATLSVCTRRVFTNKSHARPPNLLFLTAAISGGGKDDNTIEMLRLASTDIIRNRPSTFSDDTLELINPSSDDYSARSNFVEALVQQHTARGGVLYIDTEADSHYKNVAQKGTGAAAHAQAIMSTEIEIWNGARIEGIRRKDKKIDALYNPNISFHRCSQTEVVHGMLSAHMFEKGYIQRHEIFYDSEIRSFTDPCENTQLFGHQHADFMDFFLHYYTGYKVIRDMFDEKSVRPGDKCYGLTVNGEGTPFHTKFSIPAREYYQELNLAAEWSHIKRSIINAERLVILFHAIELAHKAFKANTSLPEYLNRNPEEIYLHHVKMCEYHEMIIPLLETWEANKIHLKIQSSAEVDILDYRDIFDHIYSRAIRYKGKAVRDWTKDGVVIKTEFDRLAKKDNRLRELVEKGPNAYAQQYDRWIKRNNLIEVRVTGIREVKDRKNRMTLTCIVPANRLPYLRMEGRVVE